MSIFLNTIFWQLFVKKGKFFFYQVLTLNQIDAKSTTPGYPAVATHGDVIGLFRYSGILDRLIYTLIALIMSLNSRPPTNIHHFNYSNFS